MKRITAVTLAIFILTAVLSSCTQAPETAGKERKLSVVCTIFPQYDWTRQILGDKADAVELTLLLDSRIDLHNYQPSVDDIVKISACDLFVYVGGESDAWVEDALKEAENKNMTVISLLDTLGAAAKTEEIVEGMEAHEHDHDEHEEHEDDHGEHEGEHEEHEDDHAEDAGYDEHVWLSLKNAGVLCTAIADALSSTDAGNAQVYQTNLGRYLEKLDALHERYVELVDSAPVKTLLFGDRFPFRYMVEDYGIGYYAAFAGCSAETEAGFETVIFLASKADELGLKSIMVTESSDQSIAKTIRDNTAAKDQQILVLDAMQSTSSKDITDGVTYLSVMENNLNTLKQALQ